MYNTSVFQSIQLDGRMGFVRLTAERGRRAVLQAALQRCRHFFQLVQAGGLPFADRGA